MQRRDMIRLTATLPIVVSGRVSDTVSKQVSPDVSQKVSTQVSSKVSTQVSPKRSLLDAPEPKFKLWDKVWHDYPVDDDFDEQDNGKTFRLFGVVVGMVYNPCGWRSDYRGWVYHVKTSEPRSLKSGWNHSDIHESELDLVSNLPSDSQRLDFGEIPLD